MSPYWGEKFGINKGDISGTRIINEGAFQTSLKCAEYSMTIDWKPGSGQWGVPFTCPKFRCDTFVNYIYWWGGYKLPTYSPPGTIDNPSLPVYVFRAFPYFRQQIHANLPTDNPVVAELSLLSLEEFYKAVDLPEKELTPKGINNILIYSKDINLSYDKRLFLLDKLSFVVSPSMLEQLIALYEQYSSDENLSHQVLVSTQSLYQQNDQLKHLPKKRTLLKNFYLNLLNSQLLQQNSPIVMRGVITLSNPIETYSFHTLIDKHLFKEDLDKGVRMSLYIALFLKSPQLEAEYINTILNLISDEHSADLNTLFFGAVAGQLGKNGVHTISNESKILIKTSVMAFLGDVTTRNKSHIYKDYIYPQSKGIALEALALINSDSRQGAIKYISGYLKNLNTESQEEFVLGFSSNKYMKQAVKEDPILVKIRKNNPNLYNDTVGMPQR